MRCQIPVLLASLIFAVSAAGGIPDPHAREIHPNGDQLPSNAPKWQENGRPAPDDSWRRSDGPFGAMLLITDQPDGFLEAWARPVSPDHQRTVHRTEEASRGGVVAAMILFAGCSADSLGNCRSQVDFKVLRPDGSVYAEHRAALWEAAAPPYQSLQLGVAHLVFEVELTDPLGRYRIEAVVRDQVAKRRVSLSQDLAVLDGPDRPDPEAPPTSR